MKRKTIQKGLVALGLVFIAGCASKPIEMPETATKCQEPRPQICTRDYRPTCAFKADGSSFVASNPCEACADKKVVFYEEGQCP